MAAPWAVAAPRGALGDAQVTAEGVADHIADGRVVRCHARVEGGSELGIEAYLHDLSGRRTHRWSTYPSSKLCQLVAGGSLIGHSLDVAIRDDDPARHADDLSCCGVLVRLRLDDGEALQQS